MENIHKILLIEFLTSTTKKLKLTSILLLSLLFLSSSLMAQNQRIIKGQVLDENKEPLIGATVIIKNLKSSGTITDVNGHFSLSLPSDRNIIQISYISCKTQEINVADKNNITVTMQDNNVGLSDVVVVGYGKQKKASVVGAITQTTGKVLERAGGITDIGAALTGNLPGVVTIASSG